MYVIAAHFESTYIYNMRLGLRDLVGVDRCSAQNTFELKQYNFTKRNVWFSQIFELFGVKRDLILLYVQDKNVPKWLLLNTVGGMFTYGLKMDHRVIYFKFNSTTL